MAVCFQILIALCVIGLFGGSKSETFTFPLFEIQECLQKGPRTLNCRDTVCMVKKCVKRGYDLLYQNSTYGLEGDRGVQRTAHCALDKCIEGIMEMEDVKQTTGLFSGFAEPFQACLYGMRTCVQKPRVEL